MEDYRLRESSPRQDVIRAINDLVPDHWSIPEILNSSEDKILFRATSKRGETLTGRELAEVLSYLQQDLRSLTPENSRVVADDDGQCIEVDFAQLSMDTQPTDLDAFRKEKDASAEEAVEAIKGVVFDAAYDHLLDTTSGKYVPVFGRKTVDELELYVMSETIDLTGEGTPEHIVKETGIAIANQLATDPSLNYTVDLGALAEGEAYIKIVKM